MYSLAAGLFLYYQTHIFNKAAVFFSCRDYVNSRRVDTAVTEYVGEFGDVLFDAVKDTGEQMAKIVRKDFIRVDARLFAQAFHVAPYISPAYRISAACDKNTP